MASSDVNVKVKVDSKGMGQLEKDTKKAKKANDDLAKSQNSYQKREKGSAGITSNSTKAFSKMTTGIEGGLVPAYATLAANVFAVTAAFGVLQRAAAVDQLASGMRMLGEDTGYAMMTISKGLQKATKNALSFEEAMRSTAMITSAGFDASTVEEIGVAAQKSAAALGRGTQESLERFTRGLVKMEAELLDELGLFPRVDDASKKYADNLGKSVTQLTQFEKRQAFANAALDEAKEKFGAVEVDSNPYDQLAATFADLSKAGLSFANTVLKPIAGFLAESPGMLLGLFGVFASGIIAQITPSIENSAEAAAKASKAFAVKSARAAKVVSKDYKAAAKNVQNSWATVPKSVAKLAPQFKNGTYTAQELKIAIQRLKSSEQLRAKAAVSSSAEVARARQMELAQVTNLRMAMQKLQQEDKNRMTLSAAGSRAKSKSIGSGLTARGLKEMDAAESITKKFGIALRYSVLQIKNLGRTPGVMNKIRVAFTTAAGAARLFGTALLQAIPVIGQIIMVVTLLKQAFDFVKDAFTSAEQKALNEAVENSKEPMKELISNLGKVDERLKSNSTETMRTTKGYIAYSNSLNTLNSQLEKFAQTGAEKSFLAQRDALIEVISNSKTFRDAYRATFDTTVIPKTQEGVRAAVEFAKSQELISGRVKGVQAAFTAAATATTKFFNSTKETSSVSPMLDAFTELDNSLVGKQVGEIQTIIDEQLEKNPILGGLITAISNDGQAIDAELTKQKATLKTQLQQKADIMAQLDKAAMSGDTETLKPLGLGLGAIIQSIDKTKATIKSLSSTPLITPKSIANARAFFKTQNDSIINGKKQVKTLQAQLATEKAVGSTSLASLEKQIGLQNAIRDKKVETNNVEIALYEMLVNSGKLTAEDANNQATINALKEQNKQLTEENILGLEQTVLLQKLKLSNLQVETNFENSLISLAQKKLSFAKTELALREQVAIAAKKAENRGSVERGYDPTLTAKDTKDIEEGLLVDRIKNAVQEHELKKLSLDLEYALLEQRLVVAQQEAKLAAAKLEDGDPRKARLENVAERLGTSITNMDTLRQGAETQLQQQFGTKILGIVQGFKDKADAALNAGLQGTQSGSREDRIKSLGTIDKDDQENLPLSQKIGALSGAVGPMVEQLAQLGPEGEMMASITQGAMSMASAFSTAFESIEQGGSVAENGLAMAGAALQGLSQMQQAQSKAAIAGIDKQIEAEKKRDGKSQGSLAKIAAMEKKKEVMQRKAFETKKKMDLGGAIISTALGITRALAEGGPIMGPILATMIGALGAAQISAISSQTFDGGGTSAPSVPTSVAVGNRGSSIDMASSKSAAGELAYTRGSQGIGGANNFTPAFTGAKYRAAGGNTAFVVGEQGPEMFVPDRPGTIVPADETAAGLQPTVNANINISAVDAQGVEEVLLNQRGNIIGMLREAANSNGETFLESVNTLEA